MGIGELNILRDIVHFIFLFKRVCQHGHSNSTPHQWNLETFCCCCMVILLSPLDLVKKFCHWITKCLPNIAKKIPKPSCAERVVVLWRFHRGKDWRRQQKKGIPGCGVHSFSFHFCNSDVPVVQFFLCTWTKYDWHHKDQSVWIFRSNNRASTPIMCSRLGYEDASSLVLCRDKRPKLPMVIC